MADTSSASADHVLQIDARRVFVHGHQHFGDHFVGRLLKDTVTGTLNTADVWFANVL